MLSFAEGDVLSVELYRECKNCGTKLKQHVSFSEDNGRITIKVYRYKCPFCDALIKKPTAEEIRSAIIRRAEERNGQKRRGSVSQLHAGIKRKGEHD